MVNHAPISSARGLEFGRRLRIAFRRKRFYFCFGACDFFDIAILARPLMQFDPPNTSRLCRSFGWHRRSYKDAEIAMPEMASVRKTAMVFIVTSQKYECLAQAVMARLALDPHPRSRMPASKREPLLKS